MSSESKKGSANRSLGAEMVIPVTAMAFAIYYVTAIWGLPWEAQVNGLFLSLSVWVTGGIVLVRVFRRRLVEEGSAFGFEKLIGSGTMVRQRLGLIALTIGYIVILPWLGFTLTTAVFLAVAMVHLGVRAWGRIAVISASLSLLGWGIFIVALNSRLPRGPFEKLMAPFAALLS